MWKKNPGRTEIENAIPMGKGGAGGKFYAPCQAQAATRRPRSGARGTKVRRELRPLGADSPATGDVTVFLFDCDNTLLDNDRVQEDLQAHLEREFGAANRARYWQIFEALRRQLGYADYLGALQRYRLGAGNDPRLLQMSAFLVDYPFAERLYPDALNVLARVGAWGPTVILSDGDVVFQPRKIERSGLWRAVEGRVLIYIHKEKMLADVEQRYPARHYVMVDDKLRILAAMKTILKEKLTTVFPRQGHYAHDPHTIATYRPADLTLDCIGDLIHVDLPFLLHAARASHLNHRSPS